ncbi:MAG: hypothetical protein WC796_03140 [Candidatus Pacearchaeota archaeon]|jgi:hypothetical protein
MTTQIAFEERKGTLAYQYFRLYGQGALCECSGKLRKGPPVEDLDKTASEVEEAGQLEDAARSYEEIAAAIDANKNGVQKVIRATPTMREIIGEQIDDLTRCYRERAVNLRKRLQGEN